MSLPSVHVFYIYDELYYEDFTCSNKRVSILSDLDSTVKQVNF